MEKKSSKTRNLIGIILIILIGLVIWSMVRTQSKLEYSDSGLAEYEKGNYQKAIENYTRAIEANLREASLYNNRGLAYYSFEKYDKAISDYNRAIELEADYKDAYFNRGLAYFKKSSSQEAISDLGKAIELDPKYADAYYNRGLGYNQSFHYYSKPFTEEAVDKFDRAVADFNKVLELDLNYVLAYAGLGNSYYRHGEWDKATEYYNKALGHEDLILKKVEEKGLEEVYYSRARNYNQFQRTYDDALSDYKKVLELNPENLEALSHMGMISAIVGDYKEGLEVSNKGINLVKSGEEFDEGGYIYSYRAQCYFGLGEYDKAMPDFEKAMETPTLTGEACRCIGFCYLNTGETKKAKEFFEKGIAYITEEIGRGGPYGPGTEYRSYNQRGLCYMGLREYDKAISDFEKTREHNRPYLLYGKDFYVEGSKNLGIAYREKGDVEKAKTYFEEALKRAELPKVGMTETAKEIRELMSK